MNLKEIHSVYFIGIGGIGMSAVARYFNEKGISVEGYDKVKTELTSQLESEGMRIHYTDSLNMVSIDIQDTSKKDHVLIVYTPAISADHSELSYFVSNNYTVMKRSEVLGLITENTYTIAVAGTHGKTTTSSMITYVLKSSGYACDAFLGGIITDYNSNVVFSEKSKATIVEADEYDRSFLTLSPDISIVTSMDADHLDVYGEHKELEKNFQLFVDKLDGKGVLIYKNGLTITTSATSHSYGLKETAEYRAENIRVENGTFVFDYVSSEEKIEHISLGLPGIHNVENAMATILVAKQVGISSDKIKAALASFKGVKRRFEYQIKEKDLVFIDDYAHHPEELKACINSVKQLYPGKNITGVFQPHLYSRTRDFADAFARSLELLDEVLLLDIYPAREKPIQGVNSEMLLEKIKLAKKSLCSREELVKSLKKRKVEVLLTLGAGDIDELVKPIKQGLLNQ